jgi:Ca2+-binding EF-hand superfamily protein
VFDSESDSDSDWSDTIDDEMLSQPVPQPQTVTLASAAGDVVPLDASSTELRSTADAAALSHDFADWIWSPLDLAALQKEQFVALRLSSTEWNRADVQARIMLRRLASDFETLMRKVSVTKHTLRRLHALFCQVTSSKVCEVMLFEDFCSALNFSPSSLLVKRIFDTFDVHRIQALNFLQFALGACILFNHCPDLPLVRFTFDIYDLNKDGMINFVEMYAMLENSLAERGIEFKPEDLHHMCKNTLRLLDPERRGGIVFVRYQQLVQNNPAALAPFTISLDQLFARFAV